MTTYTIPSDQYRLLVEVAGEHFGHESAHSASEATFHPGDPLGNLLCDAWAVDRDMTVFAMGTYMMGLRQECDELDLEPPTFEYVVAHLPWAVNSGRYPNVDVAQLQAFLRGRVPAMFGANI